MPSKTFKHYIKSAKHIYKTGGGRSLYRAFRHKLARKLGGGHKQREELSPPATAVIESGLGIRPASLGADLVILVGVPYDDIGGGQRAAQLTRVALKSGMRVVYVYVYRKFDFEQQVHIASNIQIPGLRHCHIDDVSPSDVFSEVSITATVLLDFPHPKFTPYFEFAKKRRLHTVFELIDDWETSLGTGWFDYDAYRDFVLKADVVVGTAKALITRIKSHGREDALYLPNAANEKLFDKYKKYERPGDLPKCNGTVALYFGSLYGEWFAWDYVVHAAESNPEMMIVLIGDCPPKSGLPKNIVLLGGRPIETLPAYLFYSDICLLPFVPGAISDAVSPIKVFEYLFMEKAVVSTPLPEIVDYPGVFCADSPEIFSRLCKSVSANKNWLDGNDEFISQNSWLQRLGALLRDDQRIPYPSTVSAIILIHNNRDIIGRCLKSLLFHAHDFLSEIIVVDNASTDGGAEYVEANFPNVVLLRNERNGCSSGRNLGALRAKGDVLAFFDSDQWFTSAFGFSEALSILKYDASVGAVGWGAGWFDQGRDDFGGMITDFCPNRGMNDASMRTGYRTDIGYLATCGMFVPRHIFEATGGFDEFYDPTCFEDTDLSFAIKAQGYKLAFRDLSGIRHQPHQTTRADSQSDAYAALFRRNAKYFGDKWRGNFSFFSDYEY